MSIAAAAPGKYVVKNILVRIHNTGWLVREHVPWYPVVGTMATAIKPRYFAPGTRHGPKLDAVGRPATRRGSRRVTLRSALLDVLDQEGVDPILCLCRFVKNQDPITGKPFKRIEIVGQGENAEAVEIIGYDERLRFEAVRELAGFLHPKLKRVEHSDPNGDPIRPPNVQINFIDGMDVSQSLVCGVANAQHHGADTPQTKVEFTESVVLEGGTNGNGKH